MKKWLFTFLFLLFSYSAIAANPSDCGFYDVGCVANQFGVSNYGNWLPPKGRILYFGDERSFQIDLYFDQDVVDFYNNNPWAGFEIDIIPITGHLPMIQARSVYSDEPNSKPMRDTIVGDTSGTRGITVTNPSAINEGWVSFSFRLKNDPPSGTTIKANIQLVANAFDSSFVSRIWDNNSWWWFYQNYWNGWFKVAVAGNIFAYAMPGGGEKVFSFFLMRNAWQVINTDVELPFIVNNNTDGKGMYWTSRGNDEDYAKKCTMTESFVALDMPILLPVVYDVNASFIQWLMQDALEQLTEERDVLPDSSIGETSDYTYPPYQPYTPGDDPNAPTADIHISHLEIGWSQHSLHDKLERVFQPGESKRIHIEGRAKNAMSHGNFDMVRYQYCVTNKKKFLHSGRKWLDQDFLDDDELDDLDPGDRESKTARYTTVRLSSDLKTVTVATSGGNSYTFAITDRDRENNKFHLYFWLDMKAKVGNSEDRDVSTSQGNRDEYGHLVIFLPNFKSAFEVSKVATEVGSSINFTNHPGLVNNANVSYYWDFGDGYTSASASPSHTYTQAGVYTVRLATTANWGEQKTSLATVVVIEPEPEIDPEDYCHETGETATNGGWGWNPVQEVSCVPESQNFCHETAQTATNGGWGWNPYTEEGCEFDGGGNSIDPEDYCHETAETETNGGWGWNPVQEVSCVPESQNFCHETAQTATNGGWGWNPYTEEGCLVEESEEDNENNLIQNADFSNSWDNWIDATWNVTSVIDIFDNRAVITITDNSNGGDAKLFHNEVSVTAGNYTFGATITNDVEVTAMLLLKKIDGSEEWDWAGVIPPSATEQTVTFSKTISADVTTARVIMSIKDIGTLGIDDYFLIKE